MNRFGLVGLRAREVVDVRCVRVGSGERRGPEGPRVGDGMVVDRLRRAGGPVVAAPRRDRRGWESEVLCELHCVWSVCRWVGEVLMLGSLGFMAVVDRVVKRTNAMPCGLDTLVVVAKTDAGVG